MTLSRVLTLEDRPLYLRFILRSAPRLTHLFIESSHLDIAELQLHHLVHLENLMLEHCSYAIGALTTLSSLLHLTSLTLCRYLEESEAIAIGKLTMLETLKIFNDGSTRMRALPNEIFASHFSALIRLQRLKLQQSIGTDAGLLCYTSLTRLTSL